MRQRPETEDEAYERWRDDEPEEHEEMLRRLGIPRSMTGDEPKCNGK